MTGIFTPARVVTGVALGVAAATVVAVARSQDNSPELPPLDTNPMDAKRGVTELAPKQPRAKELPEVWSGDPDIVREAPWPFDEEIAVPPRNFPGDPGIIAPPRDPNEPQISRV